MSPLMLGTLSIIVLTILIMCGTHIGVALGTVGVIGLLMLAGVGPAFGLLDWLPFNSIASFGFVALPLFMLMGEFAYQAGISESIFDFSYKWLGRLKGGLLIATVGACAIFAACSGSSIAATATMTRVCYPQLKRFNYDKGLSLGCIASSGSLAVLIPPSGLMVIYAILTETSLVKLMMAGFIPGIVSAIIYMIFIHLYVRAKPSLGPPGEYFPLREKLRAVPQIGWVAIIIIFMIGGMYGGIFTATEAAATGSLLTLSMALVNKKLTRKSMNSALGMAGVTTCSVNFIMVGAFIYAKFLARSGLSAYVVDYLVKTAVHPLAILAGIIGIYFILGCLLDAVSMMAVSLPFIFPVVVKLGYDPVWFGIIVIKMIEVGVITPPVSLNVYTVKGVLGDEVSTELIFRNIVPFLFLDFVILAILIAYPEISLWLPNKMK